MRVMLIDDEPLALELLESLLKKIPNVHIIGAYTNPLEGKRKILRQEVDLVFLDINLPEMSGVELAEQLSEKKPDLFVIFITAYDEYAVQAFELNAVDYIVKPLQQCRLEKGVARIQEKMKHRKKQEGPVEEDPLFIKVSPQLVFYSNGQEKRVSWRTTKAKELFLYLLYKQNELITRDFLIEMLWPESDPEKTGALLYTTVYHVRSVLKLFKDHFALKKQDDGYILLTEHVLIDTVKWEKAIKRLLPLSASNLGECIHKMKLFEQPYLERSGYDWAEHEQYRLELLWTKTAIQIASQLWKEEQYTEAEGWFIRLSQRAPYHEETYHFWMQMCRETGQEKKEQTIHRLWQKTMEEEYGMPIGRSFAAEKDQ